MLSKEIREQILEGTLGTGFFRIPFDEIEIEVACIMPNGDGTFSAELRVYTKHKGKVITVQPPKVIAAGDTLVLQDVLGHSGAHLSFSENTR